MRGSCFLVLVHYPQLAIVGLHLCSGIANKIGDVPVSGCHVVFHSVTFCHLPNGLCHLDLKESRSDVTTK